MPFSTSIRERGSAVYQLTLLSLSVYVLSALIAESFFITDPEVRKVLQYIDFGVCLFFLSDFFYNFYRAESRAGYMKWGWIDLISSIPMVDPLRWGRLARVVRILRVLRAIRSLRVLYSQVVRDKMESLTLLVFLFTFVSYTLSACLILEFERGTESPVQTASAALWWSFLNVMNAKTSIDPIQTAEGALIGIYLNKVGLLLFAYLNAMIIAWLLSRRSSHTTALTDDG